MVAKKSTGRQGAKPLKLKKETIRDLDSKSQGKNVKAGRGAGTGDTCGDFCSVGCTRTLLICPGTRIG